MLQEFSTLPQAVDAGLEGKASSLAKVDCITRANYSAARRICRDEYELAAPLGSLRFYNKLRHGGAVDQRRQTGHVTGPDCRAHSLPSPTRYG